MTSSENFSSFTSFKIQNCVVSRHTRFETKFNACFLPYLLFFHVTSCCYSFLFRLDTFSGIILLSPSMTRYVFYAKRREECLGICRARFFEAEKFKISSFCAIFSFQVARISLRQKRLSCLCKGPRKWGRQSRNGYALKISRI